MTERANQTQETPAEPQEMGMQPQDTRIEPQELATQLQEPKAEPQELTRQLQAPDGGWTAQVLMEGRPMAVHDIQTIENHIKGTIVCEREKARLGYLLWLAMVTTNGNLSSLGLPLLDLKTRSQPQPLLHFMLLKIS